MELKYVVLTIIKILISVPAILLLQVDLVHGVALMGGHLDNKASNATIIAERNVMDSNPQKETNVTDFKSNKTLQDSEEIPDPSPLVLPGYNLPENIFNKGKPFYLDKDPLTGQIDFDSKTPLKLDDDLYDYVDDEPTSSDLYDKSNIDRKDGSLGSHKPSDVNQLTPNFHDFLNLPVKYNSDKYVYPLISSSYANTKIQGNVNKYHNHKDYNVKTSTHKAITGSPTYYSSTINYNYNYGTTKTTRPTTTTTTTTPSTTQVYVTSSSQIPSLMNLGMSHPSFSEDFDYYDQPTERDKASTEVYLTTKDVGSIYLTTRAPSSTTTKRTMSLFEQLFGDYDETVTTTERTKPPPLFQNLPSIKNTKNKYETETKTEKMSYQTSTSSTTTMKNVISESPSSAYEYEDEYGGPHDDNVAVENKFVNFTVTQAPGTTTTSKLNGTKDDYVEYEEYDSVENKTTISSSTTEAIKVTSLPLGENHVTNLNNPIIVATQNLREKLASEKVVPKPFSYDSQHNVHQSKPPSTSNIHIAPDQDTVSFVVGHHQNVDGGTSAANSDNGQYVGTSLKESPYDSNPFRPLYGQQGQYSANSVSYTVQTSAAVVPPSPAGSAVTIQPQKNSEASLAIGVPVDSIVKQVPGQVVDEKLEITFPKSPPSPSGSKIVFPEDVKNHNHVANLVPPPLLPPSQIINNREVLKLNSKPMYHQLPSDLTPPKEKEVLPPPPPPPSRLDRPRPPWDPRPGHFYSGKPEYSNRPQRPPPEQAYKRIDNLPNILPQFRPNMNGKNNVPPHHYNRQPLLDRPSNRPVGFFEKLQPPPPPKNLHNLRKIPQLPPPLQSLDNNQRQPMAEDRIINEGPVNNFYQSPPKVVLANRRIGNIETGDNVETLQMIQAKKSDKKEIEVAAEVVLPEGSDNRDSTEKPLYVVYPVNTPPIKLDVIDSNKKESVVIGTRAELPLPPSKINQDFNLYAQKERNDAPILKPHPRPPGSSNYPIKSDFPYPLERPDPSVLNPVPEGSQNYLDEAPSIGTINDADFVSGNQWNTIGENLESRIVTGSKPSNNQISATLKTFTEKPIAVAYTPTEAHHVIVNPNHNYHGNHHDEKYSMPNYGSPVIPEIRPGTVDDAEVDLNRGKPDSEFTVSAVMHTHLQPDVNINRKRFPPEDAPVLDLHDVKEEFQAPFQASVSVDSLSQGWSVVRDKNKPSTTESGGAEVTTLPLATTSEFDIENFKPQLEGGFKPIYTFPEETHPALPGTNETKETEVSERKE